MRRKPTNTTYAYGVTPYKSELWYYEPEFTDINKCCNEYKGPYYKEPHAKFNKYWNAETKKTYDELYLYFKPENYYDPVGYYSERYKKTYYDGYGHNFFYGQGDYYEYTWTPEHKNHIEPIDLSDLNQ